VVIADRLNTFWLHWPQKRTRSLPYIHFHSALQGAAILILPSGGWSIPYLVTRNAAISQTCEADKLDASGSHLFQVVGFCMRGWDAFQLDVNLLRMPWRDRTSLFRWAIHRCLSVLCF